MENTVEPSFFLPGIISLFILCVGITWNNSSVGGGVRAEARERVTLYWYSWSSLRTRCCKCVQVLQVVHTYTCASVTKQYNLVQAKGRWCYAAGKVTAGLAETNGSPQPGRWLPVTCGLTACTPGSAPGPMLSNEYGKPSAFTFTFYSDLELARLIPVRYTVTQR